MLSRIVRAESLQRNALVWGSGEIGEQLAQDHPGVSLVGSAARGVCPRRRGRCASQDDAIREIRGDFTKMERMEIRARRGEFDIIYIALPTTARARIMEIIDRLADSTVSVLHGAGLLHDELVSREVVQSRRHSNHQRLDTPFWGVDGWVKRAEDFTFSALFFWLPLSRCS